MLILNSPKTGDAPKIRLENHGEREVFHYLTPYLEKAGYYWEEKETHDGGSEAIISSYPLK